MPTGEISPPTPSQAPVLVTGAAGFLGREIVQALARAGYPVRGLVRRAEQVPTVAAAGGLPLVADVLDLPAVRNAVAGCGGIVHVAANPTDRPNDPELVRVVRVEGTENLVRAALDTGVSRIVVGSGYWVYASRHDTITEESPVEPRGEAQNNFDAERAGLAANTAGNLDVMVVRPGMVYGNGSWFRGVVDGISDGSYRVIDGGSNPWSFVSLADAGTGFVTVLRNGLAGGVYNLVDGHPVAWREFAGQVARRLGRPPPSSVSMREAERQYGPVVAYHLAAARAATPRKLQQLGWHPSCPEVTAGLDPLIAAMRPPTRPSS